MCNWILFCFRHQWNTTCGVYWFMFAIRVVSFARKETRASMGVRGHGYGAVVSLQWRVIHKAGSQSTNIQHGTLFSAFNFWCLMKLLSNGASRLQLLITCNETYSCCWKDSDEFSGYQGWPFGMRPCSEGTDWWFTKYYAIINWNGNHIPVQFAKFDTWFWGICWKSTIVGTQGSHLDNVWGQRADAEHGSGNRLFLVHFGVNMLVLFSRKHYNNYTNRFWIQHLEKCRNKIVHCLFVQSQLEQRSNSRCAYWSWSWSCCFLGDDVATTGCCAVVRNGRGSEMSNSRWKDDFFRFSSMNFFGLLSFWLRFFENHCWSGMGLGFTPGGAQQFAASRGNGYHVTKRVAFGRTVM